MHNYEEKAGIKKGNAPKSSKSCVRSAPLNWHIVKHGLDWICKTRTGFVKHGFVKDGFVKHRFVKHGFVEHGFVKHGFVKHGFVATNSNTENYPCLISFLRPSALFFTCLLDAEYSLFHVFKLTENARSRYVQLL